MRHSALLAVALVALAPAISDAAYSLTVGEYRSPTFSDGSFFDAYASTQSINLNYGETQLVQLDVGGIPGKFGNGMTVSGDGGSTITLNGITHNFSDLYSYPDYNPPIFQGGPSVSFNFGTYQIIVTPVPSYVFRQATFFEIASPAAGAVPEPASALMLGLGLVGASWCGHRRSRRSRQAA